MHRSRFGTRWARWALALSVTWLLWCVAAVGVQAQDSATGGEGEQSESLKDGSIKDTNVSDAARVLSEQYGYEASWFEKEPAQHAVEAARLRASLQARLADSSEASLGDRALRLEGAAGILYEQLEAPRQSRALRRQIASSLARNLAERAALKAERLGERLVVKRQSEEILALSAYLDAQRLASEALARREAEQSQLEERRLEEERQRLKELSLKRQAESNLEEIQQRQRFEANAQIKTLLGTEEELARRIVELTEERPRLDAELAEIDESSQKELTQRRDEVSLLLEALPELDRELGGKTQRSVDELFDTLRAAQRETRRAFLEIRERERELALRLAEAHLEHLEHLEKLEQAEGDFEESGSELGQARVHLARTRAALSELELELIELRLERATARHAHLYEALSFYTESKEALLERVSEAKRSEFYSLTRDQNWRDAWLGSRLRLMRLGEHSAKQLERLIGTLSDPFSITLWSWIGGLVLRLFLTILAIRTVRRHGERWTKRALQALLKRPFFRRSPTITLKLGELVGYMMPPTVKFFGASYLISYGEPLLPALELLQWFVNAAFLFRAVTITTSVLVLPRTVRDPHRVVEQATAMAWERDERHAPEEQEEERGAALFELDVARARKMVLSARVVTLFWLLVIYVPDLVVALIGHTVLWRIIDLAATWGFIVVIYVVLSTWRDEIARLFEKLASERLPRAVHFVNQNKDRPWGVLVIAGASLYVFGGESIRLGKRYLIETEWSKQVNNFIFRKQIEFRQREQHVVDEKSDDLQIAFNLSSLPQEYVEVFEDRPLSDEVYKIESHREVHERIEAHYNGWLVNANQGSIAIHGETGMGRSTVLFELAEVAKRRCEEQEQVMVYSRLVERCTGEEEILELVASLFGLKTYEDRADLIARVNAMPTHVVLIDDCQLLFLRKIGGFNGLETFLQIVNLTDGKHFWVLTFERFAWSYLARIKQRSHYFGEVIGLKPWSEGEIQELLWKRNLMTGLTANFTNLVVTREDVEEEVAIEVIKSAKGYFRLLHDFSKGNPRVAMLYWLRSIKLNADQKDVLDVGLFHSPPPRTLAALQENYWFTLTAIAQHGALTGEEITSVINAEPGFCEMALNYFVEKRVVTVDVRQRARLTPLYLRQILKQLTISNYLYD